MEIWAFFPRLNEVGFGRETPEMMQILRSSTPKMMKNWVDATAEFLLTAGERVDEGEERGKEEALESLQVFA